MLAHRFVVVRQVVDDDEMTVRAEQARRGGDRILRARSVVEHARHHDEIGTAAYWVGAHAEGRRAAERLLAEGRLPASERARVEENLRYYVEAVGSARCWSSSSASTSPNR